MSKDFEPEIQWRSPDSLTPYPLNNKLHPTEQIDKVAGSIAEFGFDQPIVVDSSGVIIKGHARREAALRLKLERVPIVVRDDLSEAQKKASRIADNKTAVSDFDEEAIAAELAVLQEMEYDLKLTGFDDSELGELLQRPSGDYDEGDADEDEVPDVDEVEPRSKIGDLFQLGRHKLLCGDSTNINLIKRLVGDDGVDMIFTDPPYNVDYDPEERVSHFSPERKLHPLGKISNDKMTDKDFRSFLDKVYACINEVLGPGCPIYIFHADSQGHHFRNAFVAQPWKLQSCLIWKKTVLVFGRADYHWMHEPILYGWKEGAAHRYYGDRTQTTVIECPTPHYDKSNSDTVGYVHPTQKPTTLIKKFIENSSEPGSKILDLFGGSGSTLIAAEATNRTAFISEISPIFVDVIIQRWENFTGKTAHLIDSL